jgi:hypothetical protein
MKNKVEAIKAVLGDGEDVLNDVKISTSGFKYTSDIPVIHQEVTITFTYLCRDKELKNDWGEYGFLGKIVKEMNK